MLYRGMNRAELDTAYNNSAAVLERDAMGADWAARSARVRCGCGWRRSRVSPVGIAPADDTKDHGLVAEPVESLKSETGPGGSR
jgi:hypothetical protein